MYIEILIIQIKCSQILKILVFRSFKNNLKCTYFCINCIYYCIIYTCTTNAFFKVLYKALKSTAQNITISKRISRKRRTNGTQISKMRYAKKNTNLLYDMDGAHITKFLIFCSVMICLHYW